MITLTNHTRSRSDLAMPLCMSAPVSRVAGAAWPETVLEITGRIAATEPRIKGYVRQAGTDVQFVPGTRAWSPPT